MSPAPNIQREPGLSGNIANEEKGLRRDVQFTDIIENLLLFLYYDASQKKEKKCVACIGEGSQDQMMVYVLSIFQRCLLCGV